MKDGISIEINRKELIEAISVSPDIPKDEGTLLIDIVSWNCPSEFRGITLPAQSLQ